MNVKKLIGVGRASPCPTIYSPIIFLSYIKTLKVFIPKVNETHPKKIP